ncbi:sigma-70 family RNA polymerase sigma factor, partial [Mariniphaga sediminis]
SYYAAQSLEYLGDDVIEFEELMRMIDKAIEELPAELKEAFTMNRYSDMKYAEIAEKLQVSIKTVEARISRALKILRKELKGYLSVIFMSF